MTLGYLPAPEADDDGIEFFEFTAAEWKLRTQVTLADAGITYEELEAQALRGYFDSMDLHALWFIIKDTSNVIG